MALVRRPLAGRNAAPGFGAFPFRLRAADPRRGGYHSCMLSARNSRIPRVARRSFPAVALLVGGTTLLAGLSHAEQRRQTPGEQFRHPYAWPSLDELVERSDTIVAGEVVDMRSAWTADRREIFTTVTLRPDRRFKGGERSLVRFRIPGGTVGDTRLRVTHSPVFAVGEQALVFLRGGTGRLPRVVAGEAGKRHIRVDEEGGATILPGFSTSETADRMPTGLSTLDDLASAMPGLLAATRSR